MLTPGKPLKPGAGADMRTPNVLDSADRDVLRDRARKAEQELMGVQMASMDELTLLSNRHGFEALARLGLEACQQLGKPATLLFFDLDHFKRINQLYGRAEGDDALKTFADVLRIAFRESDVIGRLGSDEFAALLTGANAVDIAEIRARLEEILDERNATVHRGYDIRFSVAQIEFNPDLHKTVESLMLALDELRHQGQVGV
ncbi:MULTISPECIES: GGDEF domain-containing protein [Pseudomonas]|uniref:diguanylate cyclase n=1 Tax=Pseudomonas wuhanensis TaxID=2954098 RepID=A0ABY9GJM2_9PSED|nr:MULTISPECIES: GGDEF domain-containing protein [unclassified Pseudomonas]WLI10151.1 GGDEF domain-containing protein [Pseudomonas sp. FP603]WLI15957.1 GGDEF domain-containing protein [Pseudomonas sp. FP607]